VHADAADPAELQEREDEVVVPCVEVEPGLGDDPARLVEVVVRLFDGPHRRNLGELGDRLRLDVDHDPAWDVVDDDRPVAHLRDGVEVRDDPARRRLVVVRRHHEEAVDAQLVRFTSQMDGVRRRVRARSRDDRAAALERLDRDAEELEPFVIRERRALTGAAGDDDSVRTVLDEMLRQLAEAVEVDRAVCLERRDDGRQHFAQHGSIV
jgi:hypothetical protein